MKKIVKLFAMTSILVMGMASTGMSQSDYTERYVECAVGQTFYVSFPHPFNGTQIVYMSFKRAGRDWGPSVCLGKVSAYGQCCIAPEDEGEYKFGYYEEGFLRWKLHVILTVSGQPVIIFADMGTQQKFPRSLNDLLICLQEKRYILGSEEIVLV